MTLTAAEIARLHQPCGIELGRRVAPVGSRWTCADKGTTFTAEVTERAEFGPHAVMVTVRATAPWSGRPSVEWVTVRYLVTTYTRVARDTEAT